MREKSAGGRIKSLIMTIVIAIVLFSSVFFQEYTMRLIVAAPALLILIGTVIWTGTHGRSSTPEYAEPVRTTALQTEDVPPSETGEEKTALTAEMLHMANAAAGEALRGMTKVLPILAGQLQSVIEHTEQAAMDLSNSFLNINRKAKEQVKDVQHIFGGISGDEEASEDGGVLYDIRNNLDSLTRGLDQLLMIIKKNSESTMRILRQTQSMEKIVQTSNDITENSQVLSINATIEAARAGQQGQGFAVVAREFQKMTQRSEESTREIQEVVGQISELSQSVHRENQESETIGLRLGEEAKTHGLKSVDKINTMIAQTRVDLEKLSAQTEEFARDISTIVMSIQFQDITRQRLEHVIEPLNEFSEDLRNIAGYLESIDAFDSLQHISQSKNAIERLKEKYTMESERELLEKSLNEENQKNGGQNGTAGFDS